jgi:hypothetical protein
LKINCAVSIGKPAPDDSFRRLLYQAHAMDNEVELLAMRKGPLQFRCAWQN